ncbi:MAG: nucleotide exchange factor GrpE [Elusimicrobia bacterium]|nr:nucleotide exchange factor GrpE [Elusimicrobiota bacterium]
MAGSRDETASGPESAAEGEPKKDAGLPAGDTAQAYYDQLLRLKADFENFRKRVDRERPDWVRYGEAGLLERLLPLYDLLLQAHDQVLRSADSSASKELIQGLELIFKEFNRIFESENVKVIESVGKPFHHDLHEALGFVEMDERPDGTVVEELQRGYTFQGKVLRPARVRVAKSKKQESIGGEP